MYIMMYTFGHKIMVGIRFYCIEVCYNIMYYFLHFVHVLFFVKSLIILKLLIFCKYNL